MKQLIQFEHSRFENLTNFLKTTDYTTITMLVDNNTLEFCYPKLNSKVKRKISNIVTVPSGEKNKTLSTVEYVWQRWTYYKLDRRALVILLGGGVLSDLGGFAASCYKRGIDFVILPTTLLNMVDACIGGKTGIDLNNLKNQIGVFRNAKGVFIYPEFLNTLSDREFISGFAEIIKYGLTLKPTLFQKLISLNKDLRVNITSLIQTSINIKTKIVEQDFLEQNIRSVLNFGHTIGHAVESCFLETKQQLLHGEAIAIGMICESWLSVKYNNLSIEVNNEICQFITSHYGKLNIKKKDINSIISNTLQDKKNIGKKVIFTLLGNKIGSYSLNVNVTLNDIKESIVFYNSL